MKKIHVQYKRSCKQCQKRTGHKKWTGKVRVDPKHPNDRAFDERTLVYTCLECGTKVRTVECPYLLADLFRI